MSHPCASFAPHDHGACADSLLEYADTLIRDKGLRLTPVRRATLEILLSNQRALGAYDVLEKLAEKGFGNQPPVAYRALDFLVENGLAHRIRRLNAFTACICPDTQHKPVFLICNGCDAVAEASPDTVASAMEELTTSIGFKPERMNVEVTGTCPSCLAAA